MEFHSYHEEKWFVNMIRLKNYTLLLWIGLAAKKQQQYLMTLEKG